MTLVVSFTLAAARPVSAGHDLKGAVEAAVASHPLLGTAHWGLLVEDADGRVLYQHEADALFVPASNLKLLTAAAALDRLGAWAAFETRLWATGPVDPQGTLHGALCLQGGGDPSLGAGDLRQAVAELPVQTVTDGIRVDDGAFDGTRLGEGWCWDDLASDYAAEIDALSVDENVATLEVSPTRVDVVPDCGYLQVEDRVVAGPATRVDVGRELGTNHVTVSGTVAAAERDTVTVHDPALYAGTLLRSLCGARGIQVAPGLVRGVCLPGATVLWTHRSAPLMTLATHMLKESDNFYAEMLFTAVGGGHVPDAAPRVAGILGLKPPFHMVDGSGLSRYNLVSPRLLVDVLRHQYASADMQAMLPVAATDGTLAHRLQPLKGRVHAKTGSMTGISSLSGWLTLRDGRQVVFSWLCNDLVAPRADVVAAEDDVLTTIDHTLSP